MLQYRAVDLSSKWTGTFVRIQIFTVQFYANAVSVKAVCLSICLLQASVLCSV